MTPWIESDALLKRMLFALTDLSAPLLPNHLAYVSGFAVSFVGSAVPPPPTAFALLVASRFGATSRFRADPMSHFRDLDEFGPTLDAAAERLGISATAVEKDYWVSQVLRVLVDGFRGDFIFKGGTSLSKAYRIVERFSEDIDVLVLPGERGRGTTDKLMKDMGASAAAGIGGEASPVGGAETGRHRSYEVTYPAIREATPLLRTTVLLEMGVRGGHHPHEPAAISCLLGDVLASEGTDLGEFADLEPFESSCCTQGALS